MSSYKNFLVTGDLNSEINDVATSQFCETYNLQDLVKDFHMSQKSFQTHLTLKKLRLFNSFMTGAVIK